MSAVDTEGSRFQDHRYYGAGGVKNFLELTWVVHVVVLILFGLPNRPCVHSTTPTHRAHLMHAGSPL